ncbi:MAG: hypothetical protein LBP81_00695 [Treponema sp.]|nr:hypothetical protein [Treponema sp.]
MEKIPVDSPSKGLVDLNFSEFAAPYYVKDVFRVSFVYEDSLPYEACCTIYSPRRVVTVVIIMKSQYEDSLRTWIGDHTQAVNVCCLRREIYCHETCRMVAIIRAFPSDRSSKVREDFIAKIKEKFAKSVDSAEELKAVPLVSLDPEGVSPSAFDKDHFRYGNDTLNYFRLYQELMLNYDKMIAAVKHLWASIAGTRSITLDDVAQETLVCHYFFQLFPEKLTELKELLAEELK